MELLKAHVLNRRLLAFLVATALFATDRLDQDGWLVVVSLFVAGEVSNLLVDRAGSSRSQPK